METTLRRTDLFGGAMRVEIPTGFLDASKVREVPDQQEVFTDRETNISIIIELNHRVDVPTTIEALKYHVEDYVDGNDQLRLWQSSDAAFYKLPTGFPCATLMATVHPASGSNSEAPQFTAVLMTLARLPGQKTDILCIVNVPHQEDCYDPAEIQLEDGNPGALIRYGLQIRNTILATFELRDYSIFVN